jgi:hypothetical protein
MDGEGHDDERREFARLLIRHLGRPGELMSLGKSKARV